MLIRDTAAALTAIDSGLLAEASTGEASRGRHDALAARVPALACIEAQQSPASAASPPETFRVVAWNLERGRHPAEAADLLRQTGADVVLLSEMDFGMARTGNRHTTRDLAERLGFGHLYGVEFVELGLGMGRELIDHAGETNTMSLHGNAVLSRLPVRDPFLIRLDEGGAWFDLDWHHRRLGGRMALGGIVEIARGPVAIVSVHLENRSNPPERRLAMEHLLAGLDAVAPGLPAVVAGDLNCATLPDPAGEPDLSWFETPEPREPLFAAMRQAGFDWARANVPNQTRRHIADGRPMPRVQRIDWIFSRGLEALAPRTWPAVAADGTTISDHEVIAVELR